MIKVPAYSWGDPVILGCGFEHQGQTPSAAEAPARQWRPFGSTSEFQTIVLGLPGAGIATRNEGVSPITVSKDPHQVDRKKMLASVA